MKKRNRRRRIIRNRIIVAIALLTIITAAVVGIRYLLTVGSEPAKNPGTQSNGTTDGDKVPDKEPGPTTEPIDNSTADKELGKKTDRLEGTLDENGVVTNPDSYEVLVNRKRSLPEDYVPADLVSFTNVPTCLADPEINQMRKVASEALTELFKAAKEEINIQLYARSGYRSYSTQVALYNRYVANHGQEEADTFSARPGQSEHQTGLTVDITSDSMNKELDEPFGETEEGKWVAENAHKYGFIIRYPKDKEDITGYMYEPWHLRYLGKDLAREVYDSGLTFDEFMEGA